MQSLSPEARGRNRLVHESVGKAGRRRGASDEGRRGCVVSWRRLMSVKRRSPSRDSCCGAEPWVRQPNMAGGGISDHAGRRRWRQFRMLRPVRVLVLGGNAAVCYGWHPHRVALGQEKRQNITLGLEYPLRLQVSTSTRRKLPSTAIRVEGRLFDSDLSAGRRPRFCINFARCRRPIIKSYQMLAARLNSSLSSTVSRRGVARCITTSVRCSPTGIRPENSATDHR